MTITDTQFAARFPDVTATTFVANQSTLANWTPTASPINTGMLSDIGRATIYAPEYQDRNFFMRFMKAPLGRGDSAMTAKFGGVVSRAYNPNAPDTDLFNGQSPGMTSNVAKKNLSRQIAVEVNDYVLRQLQQTDEMYGDVMASIMGASNACYLNDMWVASKEYFSGSTRNANTNQSYIMTNGVADAGFADELLEQLWGFSQRKFGYLSSSYNAAGSETISDSVVIALKKDAEWPAFNKLLSETFNPELVRIEAEGGVQYVDDFATPAGAPSGAGELIGMVVDPRAFEITPMPDTLVTEYFRNPARRSNAYFTTYEYAFQHNPFFNCAYIYAPQ